MVDRNEPHVVLDWCIHRGENTQLVAIRFTLYEATAVARAASAVMVIDALEAHLLAGIISVLRKPFFLLHSVVFESSDSYENIHSCRG